MPPPTAPSPSPAPLPPPPTAGFTIDSNFGTAPLTVTVTSTATAATRAAGIIQTAYSWCDGTTGPGPTHTYERPGTYIVTQTVTGPGGQAVAQMVVTVSEPENIVTPPPPPLTFAFVDSIDKGMPAAGSIANEGEVSAVWSITPPANVIVSPAHGTLAAGATQALSAVSDVPGSYSLTLTSAGSTITGNPQTLVVKEPDVGPPPSGQNTVTNVRTGATYTTLGAAFSAAAAGDTISATPGTYAEISILIPADGTVKSTVVGQKVRVDASSLPPQQNVPVMAVSPGFGATLEDVHLTGNKFEYGYNPGLTTMGPSKKIVLRRSEISECSNGVLSGNSDDTSELELIDSNIHDNGWYDGLTHNIYAGGKSLKARGTWVHNTKKRADYPPGQEWRVSWGHLVKFRGYHLDIQGSRITQEKSEANRCIDAPNGCAAVVRGNLLEYATTQNGGAGQLFSWGVEGGNGVPGTGYGDRPFSIDFCQNTVVGAATGSNANDQVFWVGVGCVDTNPGATNLVPMPAPTSYMVEDNIFAGWNANPPKVKEGPTPILPSVTYAIDAAKNTCGPLTLLTDAAAHDYRPVTPVQGSKAWTDTEYVHPSQHKPRADDYRGAVAEAADAIPLPPAGWSDQPPTTPVTAPVGDVWTPSRDADGVVTAASWASVPPGRWITVANSSIHNCRAQVAAAMPGWADLGTNGADSSGVTDAWNGYAAWLDGLCVWSVAAGGHAASSDDGINRFDLLRMAWSVELLPSDTTNWSQNYKDSGRRGDSFSSYSYSTATGTTVPQDNALLFDQAVAAGTWTTATPYGDQLPNGRPCSRHQYATTNYHADTDTLSMMCRRGWFYDRTAKTWKARYRDDQPKYLGGSGNWAIYDEVRKRVLYGTLEEGYYCTAFDTVAKAWKPWSCPWSIYGVAIARHGRKLAAFSPPVSDNAGTYPGKYWLYDLDSDTSITGNVQFAGGLSAASFTPQNWYYDGYAMAYVEAVGYWVIATRKADGNMGWFKLDPSSTPWKLGPWAEGAAGKHPPIHVNLCQKLIYFQSIKTLLLGNSYGSAGGMSVFKFA
jgi:PKD repeat protein